MQGEKPMKYSQGSQRGRVLTDRDDILSQKQGSSKGLSILVLVLLPLLVLIILSIYPLGLRLGVCTREQRGGLVLGVLMPQDLGADVLISRVVQFALQHRLSNANTTTHDRHQEQRDVQRFGLRSGLARQNLE